MRYILKYFRPSKYINYKRKDYIEFDSIGYLLKFIVDNNLKEFTIFEKNDKIIKKEDSNEFRRIKK